MSLKHEALILEAAAFSARAHLGQYRRDGITPYASHPFRVCFILRHLFKVKDEEALAAALLHDTLEDTATDFEDLEKIFGTKVAHWALLLSKDRRLPEVQREKDYIRQLAGAPDEVKLAKLADIYDNLTDSLKDSLKTKAKTLSRVKTYFAVLKGRHPLLATARSTVQALMSKIG
ncbi:MAG: bifunctional (p)ppGpp synthetase/guanosine-3',5'-bis(diphosphate) 3'-pyrophosphohydrolase [Candidatus Omnitrophica bacterium]|nr:bifunctional (p)ppGpp synthetase/guanosine-3',5'-bis(diphosphate) 3'-pyrophosphohydrolase [Candidatus Omnitrophota bacterium]